MASTPYHCRQRPLHSTGGGGAGATKEGKEEEDVVGEIEELEVGGDGEKEEFIKKREPELMLPLKVEAK